MKVDRLMLASILTQFGGLDLKSRSTPSIPKSRMPLTEEEKTKIQSLMGKELQNKYGY